MKKLNKIFRFFSLVAIFLFFISSAGSMAQVKKMSAEEMTKKSTAVLYGKCSKVKSEWSEDRSMIFTYITIIPDEYIKGNLGSEAVIAVPGGRVDNIIYEVSETPYFTEGEEVVAFIWTNPAGRNLVTGGYQGKVKIETDEKTGKRSVETDAITDDPEERNFVPGQLKKAERFQLEDYVVKLKGYAKN